ncbi:hypothetical protein [Chryseobacterium balustinum]|uniref:Lipoprotein n=1 Tax=Chryseobacterium balustinum TaxID=246 RepID=A0AAX2IPV5_9FLAO|nr:hypothetical protein [Chryseobacterium balustinum]SKC06979.1 hypothetical protein SAMN05421800_12627 [Chryseobacterium balustinum]SQA91823.1 Uncharacterised protein [Chryseobacterium balustinum]
MKKIMFLLFLSFCFYNCQTKKMTISSEPFNITKKIVSFKENAEAYILISDKKDIVEVFKDSSNINCREIILGKKYTFKVIPVSDLIQHGASSPPEYILNDSTIINYNHYYSLEKRQNICVK